jgi:hypothetical protein
MVNFTVLGPVGASWERDAVSLGRQQQLLLARLVYAGGKRVERNDLMSALSLNASAGQPDGGLKRVAAELRAVLRAVMPEDDPVPHSDYGYRLELDPGQADLFRFRAKRGEALVTAGEESASLMRAALGEWGAEAEGLYGGCALAGLPGRWAARTREQLGREYRDAVLHCLRQAMEAAHYREALAECEERGLASPEPEAGRGSRPPAALLDGEFLEIWLRAAFRCDQPARAAQVTQWALDAAQRSLDGAAGPGIRRLTQRVAAQMNGEGSRARAGASHATEATTGAAAMAEPGGTTTFNNEFNNAGAIIGHQAAQLNVAGSIYYNADSGNLAGAWRNDAGEADIDNEGEQPGA